MGRQNEPEKGILFFLGKGTVLGKGDYKVAISSSDKPVA